MAKTDESIESILDGLEGKDQASQARPNGKDKPEKKAAPGKKEKGVPTPQPTDARLVPVTAIRTKPHKTNTRGKLTDADLQDILPSTASVGILSAIGVIDEGDKSFTLVWGKRRLAAAKKVGLKDVPATVLDPKVTNVELASAVENIVRKDLEPMEEAKAYKVLIDGYKMSQNDLAKFIGKTPAHVSQKLALLAAPKKEQEKLASGKATESSVRKALAKTTGKGKSGPGPKTKVVNIPMDDLPIGVSMAVKDNFATITFKIAVGIKVGRIHNVGKVTKTEISKLLKNMSEKRINAAYKAIAGV